MLWGHGQPGVTWDTPKAGRVCVVSTTHGSSYPARIAGQGIILLQFLLSSSSSSSFFFLLSSICQHFNISETVCLIMLILGHNNKSTNAHSWHDQFGVKGHVGVTGVKSPFSPKMLFLLQLKWYGHGTHVYSSARYPLQKVMGLEIHPGSFGVTGVKRSFSPKMLFLLQITWYGHGTHAYTSARYPLQKLWV